MPNAEVPYDIFVSYSQADRGWVEGYLLDALAAAKVRVLSELNFSLGAPRIAEFERAMKQSKRTLLVLSPAYMAESGLQFVDLMVQSYGLESGAWPVIPLVLEEVELPPRLAFLVSLDATQVESWPDVVVRLCQDVQAGPPSPTARPPCPYPGMRTFRQDEAAHFYGREAEVEELLQRLRLHPFAVVIGPSGSGKSSLVLAGLIPALQRSALFGPGAWLTRVMRPGDHPLAALSAALGVDEISQFTPSALLSKENAARLLLVIDQFEELFTQGVQERDAFFAAVERLIPLRDCYVVITVGSLFYNDLLTSSLWPTIDAHRLEIPPLGAKGLRAAIVKPAEDMGVYIESALVERLILGSAGQPGLLPFVQELMARLWEKLERRYLPLRAYEALILPVAGYIGNERDAIIAALALLADEIIRRLSPTQQMLARRTFLRLVQFGEGRPDTRRQQSVSALRAAGDDPALLDETLNYLAENRLLVLSGDEKGEGRVDLAHEAMLTGWPTLKRWVEEGKEAEKTRRRLEERAAEWARLGRGKSGLLDKQQMLQVKEWLKVSEQQGLGCSNDLKALIDKSNSVICLKRVVAAVRLGVLFVIVMLVAGNSIRHWWINRPWKPAPGLRQVAVQALAAAPGEIAAGSSGYGVALLRGDHWIAWQAKGIPTGTPGKGLEPPDAKVDAVLALAYDPVRPNDLYAWIEGEGVFQLNRETQTWSLLGPGGPIVPDAGTPLAISNGSAIAIGDNLGIYLWNGYRQQWQHVSDEGTLLGQEFEAVVVDSNGTPYLAGRNGVLRGVGAPPWTWESVERLVGVKTLAVGRDGSIFAAMVNDNGAQLICLGPGDTQRQSAVPVPVTNWYLQLAGLLFGPFDLEAQVKMLLAHPIVAERFFVTTNQGAVFSMSCTGQADYLGQRPFWTAASSQLAFWQEEGEDSVLIWGNLGGLFQRSLSRE